MKRLIELFSKRRQEEKPQSQEHIENKKGQSTMHAPSLENKKKSIELFRDDSDLGYC